MQLQCPHCSQILEFTTQEARFCYSCGQALGNNALERTVPYDARHFDAEATRNYPLEPGHPSLSPPAVT